MKKQSQAYTLSYNKDLEDSILGALLTEREAYHRVNTILSADMFQFEDNQKIYALIDEMQRQGKDVDLVTVGIEAIEKGIKPAYVTELALGVMSTVHLKAHANYLKNDYIKNQALRLFQESASDLITGGNVADILRISNEKINRLEENSVVSNTMKPIADFVQSSTKEIETRVNNHRKGIKNGVPTFSEGVDKITGGWQRGTLNIIAARPAMGKTAVALKGLRRASENGFYPGMFAMEMIGERLIDRLILEDSQIEDWKYKDGSLTNEELDLVFRSAEGVSSLIGYIDDNSSQTVSKIKAKSRLLKKKGELDLIIIDYLQLTDSEGSYDTRNNEVSKISRELKKMAKDLDVPVIVLSQLSRASEARDTKRPQLSDLRDSGAIEQDADTVMFIHRPEYYQKACIAKRNGSEYTIENGIEIIIAKFREGATGSVFLQHDGRLGNIQDYKFELRDIGGDRPF